MTLFRSTRCSDPGFVAHRSAPTPAKRLLAIATAPLTRQISGALAILPLAIGATQAADYKLTDIGVLNPAGGSFEGYLGVTSDGTVAGSGTNNAPSIDPVSKDFIWSPDTPNGTTGSVAAIPHPDALTHCQVTGINDAHHVACEVAQPVDFDGAAIWTGGASFIALPASPVESSIPSRINNIDGVVGLGIIHYPTVNAIWWPSGAAAPLVLDSRGSVASSSNNTGSFVGCADFDDGLWCHATAWANVIFGFVPRTLNSNAAVSSNALAINDAGKAVGFVDQKPVAWPAAGGEIALPLFFGGSLGYAADINAAGDIVGRTTRKTVTFLGTTIEQVATLWTGGTVIDLNTVTTVPVGWTLRLAKGINNAGQIVGVATDADDYPHAVLLTPFTNEPPIALCKAATVSADATCTASASIDNGSHDDDSDSFSLSQLPAPLYSLGTTSVTLTATDSDGASASCSANVTVQDVTKPSVSCPATSSASAGASCKAAIPNVLGGVTASDNCSASASLAKTQDIAAGTLAGLGTTTINVSVTDASLNSGVCSTAFTVVDTSAPTVGTTLAQPVLWTPSHELVNVGLAVSVSDNCDAAEPVQVTVYSNESDRPAGDADASFSPDARNVASGTLRLRAERLQAGSGRVYLVVAQSTDSAHNTGASCTTVVVPHDQNTRSFALVSPLAAAAQAYCASHGGVAPTGYFPVGAGAVVGPKQ